jgi:hypothetical protein
MTHRPTNPKYYSEDGLAQTIAAATADPSFPQYGYGVVQATALAGALGYRTMCALEVGVAGGNGLVALEQLSTEHSGPSGVVVDVAGFDLGTGMPMPVDYRDLPYVWREAFFNMDEEVLRRHLGKARLLLGDIAETGRAFVDGDHPPIGFISFDVDYYSSTVKAFSALLTANASHYLPRVVCYFDDTVGPHHEMHSVHTGELLAIEEFNRDNSARKIGKLNGLRYKVSPNDGPWVEGIYILHLFDHDRYNDYVYPLKDRQFPLTS